MTANKAADILEAHNDWRRGGDEVAPMGNPTEIGIAIDRAVAVLRAAHHFITPSEWNITVQKFDAFESAVKGEQP